MFESRETKVTLANLKVDVNTMNKRLFDLQQQLQALEYYLGLQCIVGCTETIPFYRKRKKEKK